MVVRRSLSALDRLRVCPGSAVLPSIAHRNVEAAVGNAVHAWIHVAANEGESTANARRGALADDEELAGESRERFHKLVHGLDGCPAPAVAITELAMALLEDGTVVPIEGGKGQYPTIQGLVLPGTIDAMWCELNGVPVPFEWVGSRPRVPRGAILWVVDWKTGQEEYVTPIQFNRQLRGAAVLAAKWTGAEGVVIAIGYIDGGAPRWEVYTDKYGRALVMGAPELQDAEADVWAIVADAMAQDPAAPTLVLSPHCGWCDSKVSCPAFVAAPRAMIAAVDATPGALTQGQAEQLLPLVMATKKALALADAALKVHAREHGPIAVPGGKEWGPKATTKTSFETAATFPALLDVLAPIVGDERASELAHEAFETSKGALWDAVGAAVDEENEARKERGEKRLTKKSVAEPLFAALKEAGATTETTGEEFEARWPE